MQPAFTTFDRQAVPSNLLTVSNWRALARNWYGGSDWDACARRWAAKNGGAYVMRCDDTLIVYTRLDGGKVRKSSHKPGTWFWAT